MVSHDRVPGLAVRVFVAGYEAQEYKDRTTQLKGIGQDTVISSGREIVTVTRYIEGIPGVKYKILAEIHTNYVWSSPIVSFMYYVDGKMIDARLVEQPTWSRFRSRHRSYTCEGETYQDDYGVAFLRPMRFEDLNIVDDEDDKIEQKIYATPKYGQIRVEMHRRGLLRGLARKTKPVPEGNIPETVSEKTLKGTSLDQKTSFGAAQQVVIQCVKTSTYLDGKKNPIAVFVFEYRSAAALMELWIMPRPLNMTREENALWHRLVSPVLISDDGEQEEKTAGRKLAIGYQRENEEIPEKKLFLGSRAQTTEDNMNTEQEDERLRFEVGDEDRILGKQFHLGIKRGRGDDEAEKHISRKKIKARQAVDMKIKKEAD